MQPARLDLHIIQGATLRQVLRIMQPTFEYRDITAIAASAPVRLTVDHDLPADWPVWVRNVQRMPALNTEPGRQLPHLARVVDANTLEINPLSAAGLQPQGGQLVYNQPVNLAGATAQLSVLDKTGATMLELTPTVYAGGWIELTLTDEQTTALTWREGAWQLDIELPNGDVLRAFTGTAIVWPEGSSPIGSRASEGGWVVAAGGQGPAGPQGRSIAGVQINNAGQLVITYSTAETENAGELPTRPIDAAGITGALGYTPVDVAALASVATSGAYSDLTGRPRIPTPADIGAATAAQGALADAAIPASQKGVALGVATLDASGLVPAAQLPSYVDDVLEFADLASLPTVGEGGKIYVTLNDNRQFRWGGTAYTQLVASPGTTDNVPEGSVNLYHTAARVRGTPLTGIGFVDSALVVATDSVLQAIGKLAARLATAFNRSNHSGEQAISTVTGLQAPWTVKPPQPKWAT